LSSQSLLRSRVFASGLMPGVSLIAIFLLGLFVRLGISLAMGARQPSWHEPVNIAAALATKGAYADAYGQGVGPTAHTAPMHPLMLSVLFRIFGTGSDGALAMAVMGCVESALAFALLPILAEALGMGPLCGVLAGVTGALLPVNSWVQTRGAFEEPLSAVLLVVLCGLTAKAWRVAAFRAGAGARFGFATGVGALTTPVLLPVAAGFGAATLARFHGQRRRVLTFLATALICCAAVLTPWAVRNYRAIGGFVWTRSNFWLELQVSNNDWSSPYLERNEEMPWFQLVHPYSGDRERAKVKAEGELAYEREKRREVLEWIRAHPERFAALTVERVRLFWLPQMMRSWQSAFEWALTAAGLFGLVLLFRERCSSAWIFTVALAVYPLPYYLVQASPRYRFPLEVLLFLLAAKAVSAVRGRYAARTSSQSRSSRGANAGEQAERVGAAGSEQ
jgi:hypothetical protein